MVVADLLDTSVTRSRTAYGWLCHHAETRPDAPAVAGWSDGRRGDWWTFAATRRAVDRFASGLSRSGVRPGDRVILALPNEASFYQALIACVAVGAVAVPAPTPAIARTDAFRERINGIVADCRPVLLVTLPAWVDRFEPIVAGRCPTATFESVRHLGVAAPPDPGPGPGSAPPSPIALLQYTSGSTGRPRGVVVRHDALRASCVQTAAAYAERFDDVGVTWVPLYHDQGLITGVMRPLFSGYPTVLLSPQDFARQPLTWLTAIEACGGTQSSAPNFAYELCVRKIDAGRAAGLDLRRWRVARNAGEVVRADTVDRFVAHFAAAGFAAEAMCPSYGMAEATLTVTACTTGIRPVRLAVRRADLQRGVLTPVRDGDDAQVLLSSGVPVADTLVRTAAGTGGLGRIAISGPQLAAGYWGAELADTDAPDRWHETGDIGFVHRGHLFVLGRADDTVIHRGRNFYLTDIVAACATVGSLRPGRVGPFIGRNERTGADEVHLVAELRADVEPDPATLAALAVHTKHRLAFAIELFLSEVHFVSFGALPVTTSGKVRASEVRRRFDSGHLPIHRRG